MERNYGSEIDALREELRELRALLTGKSETVSPPPGRIGHIEKMRGMSPDPSMNALLDRMENACGADGSTGRVTYLGVFASGERQSTWMQADKNTDELLSLIEDSTAERVLACIGSRERLTLLLALLKKPRTVAQLVEEGGFSSTGQVYHHLRPLLTADLVREAPEDGKGTYVIQPHRVQGIIMLLAGISDLIDTKYSRGNWNEG